MTTDSTNLAASVKVYLRVRPLIAEEEGHEVIQYEVKSNHKFCLKQPSKAPATINPAFAGAPPLRRRSGKDAWKVFDGFTNILLDDCNNEQAYQETVAPLVEQLASAPTNQSACVFTYGHTGSGKSHTLLGYDSEMGMYKFAAKDLLEKLQKQQEEEGSNDSDKKCLLVRVTELYKDTVMDLVSEPNQQCSIRQDGNGIVRVRGPMIESEEDGKINQQPLGKLCQTYAEVLDCVEAAVESRRVGISTHHSQSSRSHLVMELEIVTPELVAQRNLLLKQETHLTRLKWLQTERLFGKHQDKVVPKWVEAYNPSILRKEIQQYEKLVREGQQEYKKLSKNLEGTLLFCDLAGNEYARDADGSTKEEMEEAAEINKSLLAVKEMIRSLSAKHQNSRTPRKQQKHQHVPYRDSKLTMMLRRHLDTSAVMLAHISPSQDSSKKTLNTLNYSSMVTLTSNTSPQTTSKSKLGKENKPKAVATAVRSPVRPAN